ncbi:c-type cytochrome [Psychrobacter sp.]|uniref:c-type cytochrome n=1 Tax=Psychrobacter sp. TaxID=56811 RepID=UPI0025F416B9|nr:c-type cytochrome [Psychrobacter sp.]
MLKRNDVIDSNLDHNLDHNFGSNLDSYIDNDIDSQVATPTPVHRVGLLLLSALTLSLAVGCGGGQDSKTATAPETTTNQSVATETTEPEVTVEKTVETEQPKAEVEATTTEAPQAEATATPISANAGAELYEAHCKLCHENGLLNAPKFGDKTAWAPRIAKGKETLYKHSAEGFNQMPAQAANGVSVEQVHAAVDYMVGKSS